MRHELWRSPGGGQWGDGTRSPPEPTVEYCGACEASSHRKLQIHVQVCERERPSRATKTLRTHKAVADATGAGNINLKFNLKG